MNKKSLFITASVLLILFALYKIAANVIKNTYDDANSRAIELYASTVKYEYIYYSYKNGLSIENTENIDVKTTLDVVCESKSYNNGKVELHGCTVENLKQKYGYVDGKVIKE